MKNQLQNFENKKEKNKKTRVEILTSVLLVGTLSFSSPAYGKSGEKHINNNTEISSLNLKESVGNEDFIKDLISEIKNELTYKDEYGTREEFDRKKEKIFSFLKKTGGYFQEGLESLDIMDILIKRKKENKVLLEELQDGLDYTEKLEQEITALNEKEGEYQSEIKQDKILKEIVKNLAQIKKEQIKENKEHIDYCKYLLKKEIKSFITSFLRKDYK